MYAVKANKSYKVTELNKNDYLAQGYDIVDDAGKVIERSPKASVTYAEYEKVTKQLDEQLKANKELKLQLEQTKETGGINLSEMTVAEVLVKYAEVKGVAIGQATSEKGILEKIKEAEENATE